MGIVIYVNCFKGVKKNTAPKNNINIRKTKMILIIPACLSMFMSDLLCLTHIGWPPCGRKNFQNF